MARSNVGGALVFMLICIYVSTFLIHFALCWRQKYRLNTTSPPARSSSHHGHLKRRVRGRQFIETEDESDEEDSVLQGRIVGGYPAAYMDVPSQVYLLDKGRFHCGGSLIEVSRTLLFITAAHCLWKGAPNSGSSVYPDTVHAVGNDMNIIYSSGHEIIRQAQKIVLHKDFDPRTDHHDIALVFPKKPIWESGGFHAVPLPKPNDYIPPFVELSGWGTLIWGGNPSHDLQKTTMPVLRWDSCVEMAEGYWLIENQFCVGTRHTAILGPCQGDSGGPAIGYSDERDEYYLAGIISYGSTMVCGDPDGVTILTKVVDYLDWIEHHVQEYIAVYGTTPEQKWNETKHNATQG